MMLKPFYLLFHSSQICYPQSTHLFSVVIYWENGSELPTFWPPTLQPYLHVFVPSDHYIPLGMVDNFYLFTRQRSRSAPLKTIWVSHLFSLTQRFCFRDFFGGTVVKNQPTSTEGMGLTPDQGTKIPHAMQQLSPPITRTACHN